MLVVIGNDTNVSGNNKQVVEWRMHETCQGVMQYKGRNTRLRWDKHAKNNIRGNRSAIELKMAADPGWHNFTNISITNVLMEVHQ